MRKHLIAPLGLALLIVTPQVNAQEKSCDQEVSVCIRDMTEKFKQRGWAGINMEMVEGKGVVITNVFPYSPALEAGFQKGDVLLSLDGIAYTEENEKALQKAYGSFRPGSTVIFVVERDGEEVELYLDPSTGEPLASETEDSSEAAPAEGS